MPTAETESERALREILNHRSRIHGLVINVGVNDGVGLEGRDYVDFMAKAEFSGPYSDKKIKRIRIRETEMP